MNTSTFYYKIDGSGGDELLPSAPASVGIHYEVLTTSSAGRYVCKATAANAVWSNGQTLDQEEYFLSVEGEW